MRRAYYFILIALIVAVAAAAPTRALAQTSSTPRRETRSADVAQPTGVIGGQVVTADVAARPLGLANVVLIGALTGTLRVTSTDPGGRFSFAGLPEDHYLVGASKPPYLGAVAGAKRPARPGAPIALANGQRIADVTVRLPPGAAITGLVTDERGKPAVNAAIAVLRWRVQGGERTLERVSGGASTDERGRYRIFGLPPGEYIVGSGNAPGASPARALSDLDVDNALKGADIAPTPATVPSVRYTPVYFPGTARVADATLIALSVGEERQNVDFRLELVGTARVDGTVMTSEGQPPPPTVVVLAAATSGLLISAMSARTMPDGRFSFLNVTPGSYALTASPGAAQSGQFATASVEIAGTDVSGLQLVLRPSLQISGRLVFEGSAPAPSLAGRQIPLRTLTPAFTGNAGALVTPTSATGAFTISKVSPGRYVIGGPLFFGAAGDSITWALQSVVVDGRDVTDLPLDITADAPPQEVVVTYGDRWQELSGRLQPSSGNTSTDYTLVVFPADKALWISGSRRIVTSRPGTDDVFRFGGQGPNTLPPGQYLLAAVTDIDRDEQFDPTFLGALVQTATPVTILPGERKVQDVVVR